jgi:hypothetical protein
MGTGSPYLIALLEAVIVIGPKGTVTVPEM